MLSLWHWPPQSSPSGNGNLPMGVEKALSFPGLSRDQRLRTGLGGLGMRDVVPACPSGLEGGHFSLPLLPKNAQIQSRSSSIKGCFCLMKWKQQEVYCDGKGFGQSPTDSSVGLLWVKLALRHSMERGAIPPPETIPGKSQIPHIGCLCPVLPFHTAHLAS